jgi:hypothetical protein
MTSSFLKQEHIIKIETNVYWCNRYPYPILIWFLLVEFRVGWIFGNGVGRQMLDQV